MNFGDAHSILILFVTHSSVSLETLLNLIFLLKIKKYRRKDWA